VIELTDQPGAAVIRLAAVGRELTLDKAGLVGEHDRLDTVAQSELREDASDVGLDRVLAEDELVGT